MSQYCDNLKVGDYLDFRGPVGEFEYISDGAFLLDGEECKGTRLNMLAGGTGITPCMQIASKILRHPSDPTQVSLIFACRETS
jgi:NAD(P)H-flavin reductase